MVRKIRRELSVGAALIAMTGLAQAAGPTVARSLPTNAPRTTTANPAKPVPASRLVKPKRAVVKAPVANVPVAQDAAAKGKAIKGAVKQKPAAPGSATQLRSAPHRPFAQLEELPSPRAKLVHQSDDLFLDDPVGPTVEKSTEAEAPVIEEPLIDEPTPEGPIVEEPEIAEPAKEEFPIEDPVLEESPANDPMVEESPGAESLPAPLTRALKPVAPTGEIFRLEPPKEDLKPGELAFKLIPVTGAELKPGVIYLHHSPTMGRMVWSFVQANGQFWHAFGPGTTQTADHFDFQLTDEERREALQKVDKKLAFEVSTSAGAKVYLRLDADNTWKLVRSSSVPSIYDLETSQRWEKQWENYIPVVHICGDTWERRDDQYQAPHWGEWMRPN